jgi:hypothetical protein
MYWTDLRVIDPECAVAELNFRPTSLRKMMRDNALRVFNIKAKCGSSYRQ